MCIDIHIENIYYRERNKRKPVLLQPFFRGLRVRERAALSCELRLLFYLIIYLFFVCDVIPTMQQAREIAAELEKWQAGLCLRQDWLEQCLSHIRGQQTSGPQPRTLTQWRTVSNFSLCVCVFVWRWRGMMNSSCHICPAYNFVSLLC